MTASRRPTKIDKIETARELARTLTADLEADGVRPIRPIDPVVADFNCTHTLVRVGGKPLVFEVRDRPHGHPEPGEDLIRMSIADFTAWNAYRKDLAKRWLSSPDAQRADRVDFVPYRYGEALDLAGTFNLFRGWPIAPDVEPHPERRCARFLDHVYANVADGNERHAEWVLGWLAELVQRPRQKSGTALGLRGGMGTGKTILGQVMRPILGDAYVLVSSGDRVTGRFNSHLASRLLVQLDEATWGGDHTAAGVLKDLVTSDTQLIEHKGVESVQTANHARLLISSNNPWIVPAGPDERRFAVLQMGEGRKQDRDYFRALLDEQANGGAAALFAYLLAYDLNTVDVGRIPHTAALREQQVRSLQPEESWWLDVLRAGELPADRLRTPGVCESRVLHAAYIEHAKAARTVRPLSQESLGHFLARQAPGRLRVRSRSSLADGSRPWAIEFPSLQECRSMAPGGAQAWDDPDAKWHVTPP